MKSAQPKETRAMSDWKIPQRDETEVFVTVRGEIAIRQTQHLDDDAVVSFDRRDLDTIVSFLQAAAKEIDETDPDEFTGESSIEPRPRPGIA
jgi:hypothetical protein